jgi:hypothetical protein
MMNKQVQCSVKQVCCWMEYGEFMGHAVDGLAPCDVEAKANLPCCSSGPLNLLCGAGNIKFDILTDE